MYQADDQLIFSASDLTGFLACRHLTQLDQLLAKGKVERPHRHDPLLDIISRLGDEHEAEYLQELKGRGLTVVEVADTDKDVESLEERAAETAGVMKSGADVIYQATFFDGVWRGHADFLLKVDTPSDLGPHSYEVWDTKLARRAKAAAVLQICNYSEHLQRLQGTHPQYGHLLLGDGSAPAFKLNDYVAYYRAVKREFESAIEASPLPTYPDPVEHCKICRWAGPCNKQRRADRHLTFVADIRKDQIKKLVADKVPTIDELAGSVSDRPVDGVSPANFARLQDQASLQVERERTGSHIYKLLEPPGEGLGFEALPEPASGDLFFDIEHAEYTSEDVGLEYLFGWIDGLDGSFTERWAHTRADEQNMYEDFVDLVLARFRSHPQMHVYHYGGYEAGALKRLEGRYGTREQELDTLLRGKVFVDLFRIVKQTMRISEESYSIKVMELFYDFERTDDITEAGSSMVEYDRWLRTGDHRILEEIRIYNEADCRSLIALRDWLEERRHEAERAWGALSRPPVLDGLQGAEAEEDRTQVVELVHALTQELPEDAGSWDADQRARWLLAQLLGWHRREEKSQWWAYFERQKQSAPDLLDDRDALAVLSYEGVDGAVARSDLHRYSFPDQETKLEVGDSVVDTRTGTGAGSIANIDFENRKVWLKRGRGRELTHPDAIGPGAPYVSDNQRAALLRLARDVIATGSLEACRFRAVTALLRRDLPVVHALESGAALTDAGEAAIQAARRLVTKLVNSYLAVQGPPGTGKTYTGARMILDLIQAGRRVGITANSHKVISNLLDAVFEAADEEGVSLKAVQRCNEQDACKHAAATLAASPAQFDDMARSPDFNLVAGTAWALGRPALDLQLDTLFIDEAGQFSLANTLAVGVSARNIILLGDPQQLNQPTQGIHPEGADASALTHVLTGSETIPSERGLFLERTFRMHPALTSYVSEAFYDARLESVDGRDRQVVDGGLSPGIHLLGVSHEGNRIFSWEEADAIADLTKDLIGRTWTTSDGEQKIISPEDLVVVAPFNAQVARLRQRVPTGVPVGTVDKFQGQEGVVAIYSITTSSPEDIPRNFEFLYSRNRLNVAVSRGKSYAIVVCNPIMLLPMCRKPEHMRLANALCLLAEHAGQG
ncbi:MAG: TM0106 family RecB-like putative nuclease [Actinomycetota bacterium]|nr:TM0106 family RecB-like putative nuclease [Actinomycetota bacterium]